VIDAWGIISSPTLLSKPECQRCNPSDLGRFRNQIRQAFGFPSRWTPPSKDCGFTVLNAVDWDANTESIERQGACSMSFCVALTQPDLAESKSVRGRRAMSLNLLLVCSVSFLLIFFVGCGGGGGGTPPPPPPQQAAAPTISLVSGTYTTAETVTVSASTGETVHCTTDGSTPTAASGSCPSTTLSTDGATTFKAYATESGYTDSSMVSATITINLPVAQSVSLPATLATTLNSTITLDSSVVTASSSCPASAVSFVLKSTDTNTSVFGPSRLASYAPDASGATFGSLLAGNAVTEEKIGTYNLTATCGSSSSTSLLTVTAAKPTVFSATPSTCPPTACSFTLNSKDPNYSANNSNTSGEQWQGTLSDLNRGACPTSEPTGYAGTSWVSPIAINGGYTSSGATLGSVNVTVINLPTAVGTDGGWSCTTDIFTVTASGSVVNKTANLVVSYDPESGVAQIIQHGNITATFNLGKHGNRLILTDDAAYLTQPLANAVAKIDLVLHELSSISTGDYSPIELAKDSAGNVYAAAVLSTDSKQGAILRVTGGAGVETIAKAAGLGATSLASVGSRLLWITPSPDGKSTVVVHVLDNNGGTESSVNISRQADHITVLGSGNGNYALVYEGGDTVASVIDLDSQKETGSVTFAGKILATGDSYVALFDGSIGSAAIVPNGAGEPRLVWTAITKQPMEDLVGGFAVTSAGKGGFTLNVNHRSTDGELAPLTLTIPPLGDRNP
jgi:hypothetical protein